MTILSWAYIKNFPVRRFKPISTWVKLYPAAVWLLDNLVTLNIIVVSTCYLKFLPINDSRCILYLLCIDLLEIIAVPWVQLILMKANNLSKLHFFKMYDEDSRHEQISQREMLLEIWLYLCEMSSCKKTSSWILSELVSIMFLIFYVGFNLQLLNWTAHICNKFPFKFNPPSWWHSLSVSHFG